uniref:Phosphoribulokinase/uridine kinase domain-containing protein n=1 Tax=viral metagenome TaxID=1070528 RepID=A0A6C0EC07_9ZZZZ
MNVVEAYIKFRGQLVVLVSGLSGSGKTEIARNIERDFKLKFINLNDYYKKDYGKIVEINDQKIIDWDSADAIDWVKFNDDISQYKKDGLVACGFIFPTEFLKFDTDIHFHVKIGKTNLLEKRHQYLEKKKDEEKVLYELKENDIELLILNKITLPHYYHYLERSKIMKFLNANENSIEKLYDDVFDYIIQFVQSYHEERHKKMRNGQSRVRHRKKPVYEKYTSSSSTESSSETTSSSSSSSE